MFETDRQAPKHNTSDCSCHQHRGTEKGHTHKKFRSAKLLRNSFMLLSGSKQLHPARTLQQQGEGNHGWRQSLWKTRCSRVRSRKPKNDALLVVSLHAAAQLCSDRLICSEGSIRICLLCTLAFLRQCLNLIFHVTCGFLTSTEPLIMMWARRMSVLLEVCCLAAMTP